MCVVQIPLDKKLPPDNPNPKSQHRTFSMSTVGKSHLTFPNLLPPLEAYIPQGLGKSQDAFPNGEFFGQPFPVSRRPPSEPPQTPRKRASPTRMPSPRSPSWHVVPRSNQPSRHVFFVRYCLIAGFDCLAPSFWDLSESDSKAQERQRTPSLPSVAKMA